MKRFGLSDFIFWLALVTLMVWIVLKVMGYINTSALVEVIPYISGVFIAGTVWQQFRNMQGDVWGIKRVFRRCLKIEHEHNLVMDGKLKVRGH